MKSNEDNILQVSPKNRTVALLLCILFGWAGLHQFYVKNHKVGIIQVLTLGGFGFWMIYDLILILIGKFADKDGLLVLNWSKSSNEIKHKSKNNIVRKFTKPLKCKIGLHSGYYKVTEGKPSCHLSRTCPDCGKIYKTKVNHKRARYYKVTEGKPSCHLSRTCLYCDKIYETKINHKYTQWDYIEALECTQVRECVYCNLKEHRMHHNYTPIGTDDYCTEILECQRCKEKRKGSKKHQWVGWDREENNKLIRFCKKCSKVETKPIFRNDSVQR